ncbi:MAG: hypothetical protein ACW991_02880 [Candidatus Hodarchaeales archaeon]
MNLLNEQSVNSLGTVPKKVMGVVKPDRKKKKKKKNSYEKTDEMTQMLVDMEKVHEVLSSD